MNKVQQNHAKKNSRSIMIEKYKSNSSIRPESQISAQINASTTVGGGQGSYGTSSIKFGEQRLHCEQSQSSISDLTSKQEVKKKQGRSRQQTQTLLGSQISSHLQNPSSGEIRSQSITPLMNRYKENNHKRNSRQLVSAKQSLQQLTKSNSQNKQLHTKSNKKKMTQYNNSSNGITNSRPLRKQRPVSIISPTHNIMSSGDYGQGPSFQMPPSVQNTGQFLSGLGIFETSNTRNFSVAAASFPPPSTGGFTRSITPQCISRPNLPAIIEQKIKPTQSSCDPTQNMDDFPFSPSIFKYEQIQCTNKVKVNRISSIADPVIQRTAIKPRSMTPQMQNRPRSRQSRNTGEATVPQLMSPSSQVQVKTLLSNFVDQPFYASKTVNQNEKKQPKQKVVVPPLWIQKTQEEKLDEAKQQVFSPQARDIITHQSQKVCDKFSMQRSQTTFEEKKKSLDSYPTPSGVETVPPSHFETQLSMEKHIRVEETTTTVLPFRQRTFTDSAYGSALQLMDQPIDIEAHANRLHDAYMSMKLLKRKNRVNQELDIEELHYTTVQLEQYKRMYLKEKDQFETVDMSL